MESSPSSPSMSSTPSPPWIESSPAPPTSESSPWSPSMSSFPDPPDSESSPPPPASVAAVVTWRSTSAESSPAPVTTSTRFTRPGERLGLPVVQHLDLPAVGGIAADDDLVGSPGSLHVQRPAPTQAGGRQQRAALRGPRSWRAGVRARRGVPGRIAGHEDLRAGRPARAGVMCSNTRATPAGVRRSSMEAGAALNRDYRGRGRHWVTSSLRFRNAGYLARHGRRGLRPRRRFPDLALALTRRTGRDGIVTPMSWRNRSGILD